MAGWSLDGRRLAYYSTQGGSEQIFTVGINNNSPPIQVTNSSGAKLSPHWVAEGRVCFSWAGSEGALGCVNPDHTGESTPRFVTRGEFLSPKWSPDGKLVVFHRHTNRPVPSVRERSSLVPGVRLLRINGAFPSFSPAGDTLSFTDNFRSIERMKIDGSDRRQVYKDTKSPAFAPAWSPLGDRIVFASDRTGDFEIYTVRPDGSDVRQLIHSPGLDMHPVWSPDGKWICFASARGGLRDEHPLTGNPQPYGDLYLMRPDGSEVRALTDDQFEDGTPAWVPLPPLPPVH